jgi:hypothetical protein
MFQQHFNKLSVLREWDYVGGKGLMKIIQKCSQRHSARCRLLNKRIIVHFMTNEGNLEIIKEFFL